MSPFADYGGSVGRRCALPECRGRGRGWAVRHVRRWASDNQGRNADLDRRGNFADSFGEDFLGLRELGIAAEFGLQSLTIPKKLLKGKKQGQAEGPSAYVTHPHVLSTKPCLP